MILSGSKDANGYPTWMGKTGANVQIDGSTTPVMMIIDGYLARVRKLEQVTISGPSGTVYIYAQFNSNGLVRVDGDTSTPPPAVASGITGSDLTKIRIFEDATLDFNTQDVKPGDILEILGSSDVAGKYQVAVVAPSANSHRLQILGVFKAALASLDYTISDPLAVTLGFDTVKDPSKFYIGEAVWDGTSVTSVKAIHFKDSFVGEWRSVDVSGATVSFEEAWNHNLFDDALEVSIQVSQASDGSSPVEQLAVASLASTLGVSVVSNQSVNTGTFNPGTSDATYSPLPSLTGSVSGSLTGAVTMDRSAAMQWTNKLISVKNVTSGVFYRDYTGTVRQTGYIRVVVSKKRV
jgi:hypothetical protein